MQPQQPDYNFIMNPAPAPRRSIMPTVGGGNLGKLIVIGIGAVVVVVLLVIIKSFMGGGGIDKAAYLSIVQDQDELTHLSQAGTQYATSIPLKNFSATLGATMPSEQTAILNYLSDNHYKPSAKAIVLKESAALDTELSTAQSSSTFDSTYANVMQQQLQTYQSDLNAAFKNAGPSGKTTLKARYANAELLLAQLASN